MKNPKQNQEPERRTGSWSSRLPLLFLVLFLCAGFTIFACRPGLLKSSVTQWLQLDRSAQADQITATAAGPLSAYSASDKSADVLFTLKKGTKVTVEENQDSRWVKIRTAGGRTGWAQRSRLNFPLPPSSSSRARVSSAPAGSSQPSGKKDAAVTVSLQQAAAPLSVRVSIAEQQVLVLDAKDRVVENFVCSTGKKGSDTPVGTFTVTDRGTSFYNKSIDEGAYYWTRFDGAYLFHSIPFGQNRELEPGEAAKLGTPASHGCVRLPIPDAKWIYDHIPRGTKVVIDP